MSAYYSVLYNGQTVGTVQETRKGLYRVFSCRCSLPQKGIFRLWLQQGNHSEKLGVLCPEGDDFTLTKSIPANRLTKEAITFSVHLPQRKNFVPIVAGQPFPALRAIPYGRFAIEDGQPGILILPE